MVPIRSMQKAVVAFIITGLTSVLSSLQAGVSVGEGLRSAGVAVLGGILVYITKNYPETLLPKTNEGGQGLVGLVLFLLGVIMVIIGGLHLILAALNDRTPNLLLDIILIVVGLLLIGSRYYDFDSGRGRRTPLS